MNSSAANDSRIHEILWRLADPQSTPNLDGLAEFPPFMFRRFLTIARVHRVLGIVLETLAPLQGVFEAQLREARRCHRAEIVQSLRVREHGAALLDAFARAGIPVALLKGVDFADNLYRRSDLRPTADIDLLVSKARWDQAINVLVACGHCVKRPQPPLLLPTGPLGEYTWVRRQDPPIEVDLHWNLINLPSFRKDISIQFDDLQWNCFRGPGGLIRSAAPASRVVIAAVHASYQHQFDRLLLLSDLAQAIRRLHGQDIADLKLLVRATGSGLALDLGLKVTRKFLKTFEAEGLEQEIFDGAGPLGKEELPPEVLADISSNLCEIRHHFSNTPARRRLRSWLRGWIARGRESDEQDCGRVDASCTQPS